jgi:DivIVA domain-containing protein
VSADRPSRSPGTNSEPSRDPLEHAETSGSPRTRVPAEIRNPDFAVSVRGYDRHAVDAYIQRVNRVVAELEVRGSPQAAVRHAVDRVTEQTKGILQQARESAEQITAAAHEEADRIMAGAKAEAADLVVNASTDADRARAEAEQLVASARAEADQINARAKAEAEKTVERANEEAAERRQATREELTALQEEAEARLRELQADTEAVWNERSQVLGDIHGMAARLEEAAGAAAARLSREQTSSPAEEASPTSQSDAGIEASGASATDDSADRPRDRTFRTLG